MRQGFFLFASGWPGVALVLLRFSVAAFLATTPRGSVNCPSWLALALYALAFLVVAGLRTRIAGALAGIIAGVLMARTGGLPSMPLLSHLLDSLVLAMAGPGAYSIDSRLFGRRTVHLPSGA